MNSPRKILIFSFAYYPRFIGGAEVAVKEITDRMNPEEFEFHLISLRLDKNLPKTEKIGNVFVYRVGFAGVVKETSDSLRFPLHYNKYLYPFLAAWYGYKLSRKHNFSLNWAIMANYSGFGSLFFKFLKPKIPFLLTLQEGDPLDYIKNESLRVITGPVKIPVSFFMYPIFKMIFTKADKLQAISNYLANWGKEMGFKGESVVVANGVDVSKFTKEIPVEERDSIRRDLNLNKEDIALVTASRLAIKNGVGDVVESLYLLPPNIKFIIIGEGYLEEKLKTQVSRLKLENRVKFLGFVSHSELPKYLKSCDIFIRSSLSEGFGNSFIEAMAASLPTIGTPVGGIVDFLADGETGYFCEPENPQSIATAINRSISDPDKSQIIQNAKNLVIEKYNWEKIVQEITEIFRS